MNEPLDAPVLLYDGECKFCHKSVDFVFKHETEAKLKFAWLQSAFATSILPQDAPESLILFVDGELHYRSTAALKLCHYLKPPFRWAKYFLLVPRPIRDGVYMFISKHRKKIMGSTSCVLPIGKEDRFL